tara:strand:- start:1044 stop:1379 length:336 start_codon:yes stop_codon:yes gene_type:complete
MNINKDIFKKKFEFKHIYINDLEETSAIYSFWFKDLSFPIYIGKTENLKRRMKEYFSGGHNYDLDNYLNNKKRRNHVYVRFFFCEIKELFKIEEKCIFFFNPKLNKDKIRK